MVITLPLITMPINLFDGEIVFKNGDVVAAPLSLSYFIGLGFEADEMNNIQSFHLIAKGYALSFIITIGLPAIIAYRVYLHKSQNNQN